MQKIIKNYGKQLEFMKTLTEDKMRKYDEIHFITDNADHYVSYNHKYGKYEIIGINNLNCNRLEEMEADFERILEDYSVMVAEGFVQEIQVEGDVPSFLIHDIMETYDIPSTIFMAYGILEHYELILSSKYNHYNNYMVKNCSFDYLTFNENNEDYIEDEITDKMQNYMQILAENIQKEDVIPAMKEIYETTSTYDFNDYRYTDFIKTPKIEDLTEFLAETVAEIGAYNLRDEIKQVLDILYKYGDD